MPRQQAAFEVLRSTRRTLSRRVLTVRLALLLAASGIAWGGYRLYRIDDVRQSIYNLYLTVTGQWWSLRGVERTVMIPSMALGEERRAYVYLPPGYDAPRNQGKHYPTLYLLHGFPDRGDGWIRYGHALERIDRAIVEGRLPPLLVICPDGHGAGAFGDSEYLDIGGVRIATYLVRDVVPWCDSRFRTLPRPQTRIIAGDSTGGYGALNLGLQHPEVWGAMLSFSGYFNADPKHFAARLWGEHPDTATLAAQSPLAIVRGAPLESSRWKETRVFLGEGENEEEGLTRAQDFAAELRRHGVQCTVRTAQGAHSWDVWRALLPASLEEEKSCWSKG
jgi:enterochelin esterase-like enzyme